MKKNYIQFFSKINSEAKKRSWRKTYDEESDTLHWARSPFPAKDRLAKISKEMALYIDAKGNINGIMIQPFLSNFVSHLDKESSTILKALTRERSKVKPKEIKTAEAFLSTSIEAGIYKDLQEENISIKDLNKFLTTVSK